MGLALLIGPDALASRGSSGINVRAALVPVFGALLWAFGSIFSRYAPRPGSSTLATGMQMLAGGAAFLIVSVIAGEPRHFNLAAVTTPSMIGYLYLVTFGSLLGFTAYIYLLGATTPAKAATYAYVNPVVAVILGWAVAGEPLTPRMLVAAAIILGADLDGTVVADREAAVAGAQSVGKPVGVRERWGAVATRHELLRLGDSIGEMRRHDIQLPHPGMQPLERISVVVR